MKKIILGIILLLTFKQGTSQESRTGNIKSIQQLYFTVDTIQTQYKYNVTVRINWMDSIIEINNTTRIKYDLEEAREFRRDSTYVPSPTDTINMNQMRTTGAQNCHSYALDKFFESTQLDNLLFTEWTVLKENRYMNSILATTFTKTKSFEPKKKKCKDCSFDKGSIIVFRNKWDTPIHTVYFDGQFFLSKYGAWPAKAEDSVDLILKRYWDSTKIEEYRLDNKKIEGFINKKSEKS
ncbi:MAG: hypothetical protein ABI663_16265 [Chryseolinea sp.]